MICHTMRVHFLTEAVVRRKGLTGGRLGSSAVLSDCCLSFRLLPERHRKDTGGTFSPERTTCVRNGTVKTELQAVREAEIIQGKKAHNLYFQGDFSLFTGSAVKFQMSQRRSFLTITLLDIKPNNLQHSLDRCLSNSLSSDYRIHHLLTFFSMRLGNLSNLKSYPESSTWSFIALINTLPKKSTFWPQMCLLFLPMKCRFWKVLLICFLVIHRQQVRMLTEVFKSHRSKWSAFLERTDNKSPS